MTLATSNLVARRASLLAIACCALAAAAPATVAAQDAFPSRPVTLVIPFPPGGSADIVGRIVGKRLSDQLGQPVVFDNRPGAGTVVAASFVARAPADGYTILLGSGSTFTINPALRPNLPYDPIKSFEPIAIVGRIPLILIAHKDAPANSIKEFVAIAKAKPNHYPYASFGTGTTSHFTAEIVLSAVGAKLNHVPYKGSAPAMTDLIGGQVPFSFDTVTASIPHLKSGKIKAIGVTTTKRSSQLPDVPTFAEAGYPDVNADTWIMFSVPKATPPAVRQRLEKAVGAAMAMPETRSALQAQGVEPIFGNAASSVAQIDRELPMMRAIARRANIQPD
jgi:tripartite-type tricarboxylate transporter receptor subunit TctC